MMSSKLRSFLKRHLLADVYSDVRWCEAVILRRKNKVTFCHVAVTSDSVYVADLAARSLKVLLSIKHITGLQLEGDRVEFLSGEIQEQSTHIVVTIASTAANRLLSGQASSLPSDARGERWGSPLPASNGYGSLDSVVQAADSLKAADDEKLSRGSPSVSSGDSSSQRNTASLKRSKHRISNFLKGLWTGKSYSSHFPLESLDNIPDPYDPALHNSSVFPQNSITVPYFIGTRCSSVDFGDRRASLVSMNSHSQEYPVPPLCTSSNEVHTPRSSRQTPSVGPGKNGLNLFIKSSQLQPSDHFQFDSDCSERKISPPILTRASSCQSLESTWIRPIPILEISGTSRSNSEDRVAGAPDGRSLRRSASAQDARGTPVSLYPRSYSVLGAPVHYSSRRSSFVNGTPEDEDKIHLYTITVNSLLYKLLYTLWRNKRLRGHRQLEDQPNYTKKAKSPDSASSASTHTPPIPASVEEGFWQLKTELLAATSIDDCYFLVKELNAGLAKLHKIKSLFWQDASFLTRLLSLLSQYLAVQPRKFAPEQTNSQKAPLNGDERRSVEVGPASQEQRQEELELCVLIYGTLIESFCDAHKLMVKVLSSNDYKVTSQVVSTVLTPAALPNSLRLTCDRWLTDATAFSDESISHLPCAPVAQLVVRCTELSIAAVHRLLLALSEDLHNSPRLSTIFKSCHLKPWLKYAVPLIIASLRNLGRRLGSLDASAEPGLFEPADETESLQVHLSVLSALLDGSSRVQRFCVRHYKEEMKYFMTAEQVETVMEGTADAATLEMCVALAENIRFRLSL